MTTPSYGAGTSIVALSDSSVTSGSSADDGVADRDEDLDDRDVVEVADVGDRDAADVVDAHTVVGIGASTSISYLAIASATTDGLSLPAAASSDSAATVT